MTHLLYLVSKAAWYENIADKFWPRLDRILQRELFISLKVFLCLVKQKFVVSGHLKKIIGF